MARLFNHVCLLTFLVIVLCSSFAKGAKTLGVSYDGRSLIINGRRELIFSGSIHYPRSTPDVWPELIARAKRGGLNTIDTYVFWNVHEPAQGKYNFEGRYDLVKFLKLIQRHKMFVILRLGPFIQAEWNYGGFPYWLREINNITFRSDNPPFKNQMKKFTNHIVEMMKDEKLFAPQGGPIILSQIENEYSMVQAAFKESGTKYIEWAAKMAIGLKTGVPWIMCKQTNAPQEVISACNGRNCGDTFKGPGSPKKPTLWTENWTAQYRVFGDPPSQRSAEDLAYSVARFFSKSGGTLINYYMYHGGTNLGRGSADFVTTRYYDEAPLDEYGLQKEPKWGHLKDLHHALALSRKALLWGVPSKQKLGQDVEAWVYELPKHNVCAAFLTNNHSRFDKSINFRGVDYFLPHRSISILPDCKTVVFNTQKVNAQHNARTYHPSNEANKDNSWKMYHERIPSFRRTSLKSMTPLELMDLTKDTTDYAWYITKFHLEEEDLPIRRDIKPVIQISNLGHAMHVFVNGKYIGMGHGNKVEKAFVFQRPVKLRQGANHIAILGMIVGLPDNGPYLERRMLGLHVVTIQGLNTGTLDLTANTWAHKVGMDGELKNIFDPRKTDNVKWTRASKGSQVTWYKRTFDAPHGDDPVIVDMSSMGKGWIWINGESIGRYWTSYESVLGTPTQSEYHIPRSFLKPKDNLIVIFEEHWGNPNKVQIKTVSRDNICTSVSEFHPAQVKSWTRENSHIRTVSDDLKPTAHLKCSKGKVIKTIAFASYGNPQGACGNFTVGTCHSKQAKIIAEKVCLGKPSCTLPISNEAYQADPRCPGTTRTLAVQAKCSRHAA
ncbi:beta-galactosidase 11-like [Dioscorea cayenensis subsp. rotundata]|uniref:Beta-galactosidase n=1 Tax=Dioscorea cayennensis subsp. rotundata TaxID=55577 RepID=A0AB40CL49_DIOCR|nr:beta-galactosidase 11-like [Dioscorea cayenensis subsp. rotundata]